VRVGRGRRRRGGRCGGDSAPAVDEACPSRSAPAANTGWEQRPRGTRGRGSGARRRRQRRDPADGSTRRFRRVRAHELSRTDACRIAVRAQLLDRSRTTGFLEVVRHLTMLQIDPISAVVPSADLVLWRPAWLLLHTRPPGTDARGKDASRAAGDDAAERRPVLYRAEMAEWRGPTDLGGWRESYRQWIRTNGEFRRDVLQRLGSFGPVTSRDIRTPARSHGSPQAGGTTATSSSFWS
jgi:hypothetical protein